MKWSLCFLLTSRFLPPEAVGMIFLSVTSSFSFFVKGTPCVPSLRVTPLPVIAPLKLHLLFRDILIVEDPSPSPSNFFPYEDDLRFPVRASMLTARSASAPSLPPPARRLSAAPGTKRNRLFLFAFFFFHIRKRLPLFCFRALRNFWSVVFIDLIPFFSGDSPGLVKLKSPRLFSRHLLAAAGWSAIGQEKKAVH